MACRGNIDQGREATDFGWWRCGAFFRGATDRRFQIPENLVRLRFGRAASKRWHAETNAVIDC